jgi:hypothetical protein
MIRRLRHDVIQLVGNHSRESAAKIGRLSVGTKHANHAGAIDMKEREDVTVRNRGVAETGKCIH